jgi:hypothetical protein
MKFKRFTFPQNQKGVEALLLLQLELGKRQILINSKKIQISSQTSENLDKYLAHERMPLILKYLHS